MTDTLESLLEDNPDNPSGHAPFCLNPRHPGPCAEPGAEDDQPQKARRKAVPIAPIRKLVVADPNATKPKPKLRAHRKAAPAKPAARTVAPVKAPVKHPASNGPTGPSRDEVRNADKTPTAQTLRVGGRRQPRTDAEAQPGPAKLSYEDALAADIRHLENRLKGIKDPYRRRQLRREANRLRMKLLDIKLRAARAKSHAVTAAGFNPHLHPHDPHTGRWVRTPGSVVPSLRPLSRLGRPHRPHTPPAPATMVIKAEDLARTLSHLARAEDVNLVDTHLEQIEDVIRNADALHIDADGRRLLREHAAALRMLSGELHDEANAERDRQARLAQQPAYTPAELRAHVRDVRSLVDGEDTQAMMLRARASRQREQGNPDRADQLAQLAYELDAKYAAKQAREQRRNQLEAARADRDNLRIGVGLARKIKGLDLAGIDAVKQVDKDSSPGAQQLHQVMSKIYGFHDPKSGLTSRVAYTEIERIGSSRISRAYVIIVDKNGDPVGHSTRALVLDADGTVTARHAYLELEPHVRGGGFARAYNDRAEQMYRAAGVRWIEINADIDVGGYAWAKQGFVFRNRGEMQRIADEARAFLAMATPTAATDELFELLKRTDDAHWEAGTAPLELEFAMVGWSEADAKMAAAAGRDYVWLGKLFLLGRNWLGRKPIVATVAEAQMRDHYAGVQAAAGVDPRGELLHKVDLLHREWTSLVANQVPVNMADRHPNEQGQTDYNEHHHDISATPAQRLAYEQAVYALVKAYQLTLGGPAVDALTAAMAACVADQICSNPELHHADCGTFCLKPGEVHPGPCKGWKHSLKRVAPGVPPLISGWPRHQLPRIATPTDFKAQRKLRRGKSVTIGQIRARLGRTPGGGRAQPPRDFARIGVRDPDGINNIGMIDQLIAEDKAALADAAIMGFTGEKLRIASHLAHLENRREDLNAGLPVPLQGEIDAINMIPDRDEIDRMIQLNKTQLAAIRPGDRQNNRILDRVAKRIEDRLDALQVRRDQMPSPTLGTSPKARIDAEVAALMDPGHAEAQIRDMKALLAKPQLLGRGNTVKLSQRGRLDAQYRLAALQARHAELLAAQPAPAKVAKKAAKKAAKVVPREQRHVKQIAAVDKKIEALQEQWRQKPWIARRWNQQQKMRELQRRRADLVAQQENPAIPTRFLGTVNPKDVQRGQRMVDENIRAVKARIRRDVVGGGKPNQRDVAEVNRLEKIREQIAIKDEVEKLVGPQASGPAAMRGHGTTRDLRKRRQEVAVASELRRRGLGDTGDVTQAEKRLRKALARREQNKAARAARIQKAAQAKLNEDIIRQLDLARHERANQRMEQAVAAGVKDRTMLAQGAMGVTEKVKMQNGMVLVRKTPRSDNPDENDAEFLAARIAAAVGAGAPHVILGHEGDAGGVWMEFVPGKRASDFPGRSGPLPADDPQMLRMLLLDALIANTDRHYQNFMVETTAGGGHVIHPIDHGGAFEAHWGRHGGGSKLKSGNPPALRDEYVSIDALVRGGKWVDNPFTQADMLHLRAEVDALKPLFDQLGHQDWYQGVSARLDQIALRAKGSVDLVIPPAPASPVRTGTRVPAMTAAVRKVRKP